MKKKDYKASLQYSAVFINENIFRQKNRKMSINMLPELAFEYAGDERLSFSFCSSQLIQFSSEHVLTFVYRKKITQKDKVNQGTCIAKVPD